MLSIPQLGTIITCYPHTPINDVASFLLDKLNTCEKLMWHSMETMDGDGGQPMQAKYNFKGKIQILKLYNVKFKYFQILGM